MVNNDSRKQNEYHAWLNSLPRLRQWRLEWLVIPLVIISISYMILLGKNCVFEINDQLDETLFTYVLNARYMFSRTNTFPEMLNGVPAGGMTVSAWLFVPLYRLLPVFEAFLVQYVIVIATAYLGMYLCVKELTDNGMIAAICGAMFMFLPFQPVYGLSVIGGPLIFYAFLCLYKNKHLICNYLLILYFALGANLVLLGYVALGFVALADIWILVVGRANKRRKTEPDLDLEGTSVKEPVKKHSPFFLGSLELLLAYILINLSLFRELFMNSGGYISHREEMVVVGNDPIRSSIDVFLHSAQHAPTHHESLLVPIFLSIIVFGVLWKSEKLSKSDKENYTWLVLIVIVNFLIAAFYGFCQSNLVVDWRNSVSGFFHYFSAYRVYWLYPTSWYVALGLMLSLIWNQAFETNADDMNGKRLDTQRVKNNPPITGFRKLSLHIVALLLIGFIILPTAWTIRQNSIWILNKSQYKNHMSVGLMSWRDYFAEDLMQKIADDLEEETGLKQNQYHIACLGFSPAVALEAGFYTIDGYSNNYSLEYKHKFREIIADELDACPTMKAYFDDWGSRCYLFTEESQNYYYLAKDADFRYEKLKLNTQKMKELGCDYLFSAAEIEVNNAKNLGLTLQGIYDTEDSYYRVYVYVLD